MSHLELRKASTGARATALLAISLIGLTFSAAVAVAEARGGETNSQQGQVVTAYLDYREVSEAPLHSGWGVVKRAEPFNKEPEFSGGTVLRGVFKLEGAATNDVAFAWDRTAGKLYLDLNGNGDLTDDVAGVFTSKRARHFTQTFPGVQLPFQEADGAWRILVDLTLADEGRLTCDVAIRSVWEGKLTLHGEEWQVALLRHGLFQPATPGTAELLLRPWGDHAKQFDFLTANLESMSFPSRLFFGGHAYDLRCADEGRGEKARIRLEFAEQEVKLGELKITGAFVRRVMLDGGRYRVLLDNPDGQGAGGRLLRRPRAVAER